MADPVNDQEQEVDRLTLELSIKDLEFLGNFAAFRNAMADAQEKKLSRRWSRKALAEAFLAAACDDTRGKLAEMFAACGPLPSKSDREGMAKYARRVLAWERRQTGK
jgi:hypothetical protein